MKIILLLALATSASSQGGYWTCPNLSSFSSGKDMCRQYITDTSQKWSAYYEADGEDGLPISEGGTGAEGPFGNTCRSWLRCEVREECIGIFSGDTSSCVLSNGATECCSQGFETGRVRYAHDVMCTDCRDGHIPTALNNIGLGGCIANNYPTKCVPNVPYVANDFMSSCPTSSYRTNKCLYNFNNTWVEKAAGEAR